MKRKSWDDYFLSIVKQVAERSTCLSRNIGCILVKDNVMISSGYNGPARGIPHCGKLRNRLDDHLRNLLENTIDPVIGSPNTCPRRKLGHPIGTGLELCTAVHAEMNCIIAAARIGISTKNSILYTSDQVPCSNCFSSIINSGIKEIVCTNLTPYRIEDHFVIDNSNIKIRLFESLYKED